MCSRVAKSLDSLLTTRSKFTDSPLFHSVLEQLLKIFQYWTCYCLTAQQRTLTSSLSNDLVRLWKTVNFLFNSSLTFAQPQDFSRYNGCQNYLRTIYFANLFCKYVKVK